MKRSIFLILIIWICVQVCQSNDGRKMLFGNWLYMGPKIEIKTEDKELEQSLRQTLSETMQDEVSDKEVVIYEDEENIFISNRIESEERTICKLEGNKLIVAWPSNGQDSTTLTLVGDELVLIEDLTNRMGEGEHTYKESGKVEYIYICHVWKKKKMDETSNSGQSAVPSLVGGWWLNRLELDIETDSEEANRLLDKVKSRMEQEMMSGIYGVEFIFKKLGEAHIKLPNGERVRGIYELDSTNLKLTLGTSSDSAKIEGHYVINNKGELEVTIPANTASISMEEMSELGATKFLKMDQVYILIRK